MISTDKPPLLEVPPRPLQPEVRRLARKRATPPAPRLRWFLVAACLAVVAGVLAWYFWQSSRAARTTHFETRMVDRGPIRATVSTTGTLQPVQTVTVGSQISGQIKAVYVDYNSHVKKGQLLATIDPATLLTQKGQAEADVANADGALQNAGANVVNGQTGVASADAGIEAGHAAVATAAASRQTAAAQVRQARAAVEKVRAQMTLDRLTYDRNVDLSKRDLIAVADLDVARATLAKTQADLSTAEAQVAVAQAGVANADASYSNALASLKSADIKRSSADAQLQSSLALRRQSSAQRDKAGASLGLVMVNLGYAGIRSPVDGVVISRLVDPGQTVASSFQTPALFTIATDLAHMQIKANVDESDISHVFPGQLASFTVSAWDTTFSGGRVVLIRNAPQTVQNVVTYEVLIKVSNAELKLRPGMTATLTLEVANRDNALRVPNAALRYHPRSGDPAAAEAPVARGRQRVWTVDGTTLKAHDIKTGITDGATTEVLGDGLVAGDAVVVGVATGAAPAAASTASPSSSRAPQLRLPRTSR